MIAIDRDLHSNNLFDLQQVLVFFCIAEGDALTAGPGASRTADAVHIGLGFERHIEIDHMADLVDIDPASGDVRSDQDPNLACAKRMEDPLASVLRASTMDPLSGNPCIDQGLVESIRTMLGPDEYQDARSRFIPEQSIQQLALVAPIHKHHALLDPIGRSRLRGDHDGDVFVQESGGKRLNRSRHGGREEHRLAFARQQPYDPLNVWHKAHIEHPIGFVQHEVLQFREETVFLVDQIEQPTGGCNHDVDPFAQGRDLRPLADPTENRRVTDFGVPPEVSQVFGDLDHQFACRGNDQSHGLATRGVQTRLVDFLEDRDRKGGRFTCARLGAT